MPVLCKRGASFKPDIIIVAYKLLILYHNILEENYKDLHFAMFIQESQQTLTIKDICIIRVM